MKKLANLKGVNILSRNKQKQISGKGLVEVCSNPYLNADPTCMAGYHPHPTHGVCICCLD